MLIAIATIILIALSPFILYIVIEFHDWKTVPGKHRFYKKTGKHHAENKVGRRR
jgi:hypothetical protein